MRGHIGVESKVGEGTTFTFNVWLDIVPAEEEPKVKDGRVIQAMGRILKLADGRVIELSKKELDEKPFWRKR